MRRGFDNIDNGSKMNDVKNTLRKSIWAQFGFTVFIALFGAIYEFFSHEVYSYYMIYAFGIPLILGVGLQALILQRDKKLPSRWSIRMWNYGIVTLTIGSVYKGVLDIFGTTNRLLVVYPVAAALLLALGLVTYFASAGSRSKGRKDALIEKEDLKIGTCNT